jgi:type III restriction enzyme
MTVEEASFDMEYFEDGHIYFLNTQKLGKSSNLTKRTDNRQYTIWDTLRNTVQEKSNRFTLLLMKLLYLD